MTRETALRWRLVEARPEDAAPLAAFAERTFRATFAADNSTADMDAYCAGAFGEAAQARELADPHVRTVLARDDADRLVGYLQTAPGRAPAGVESTVGWELRRLYVDAHLKGAGLAGALMTEALAAARSAGADVLWLGVWERNPRAIAFYQKHGFRSVGDHVFLLGSDPQRDLLMARSLEAP